MAGAKGIEPSFSDRQSGILPLNDVPSINLQFAASGVQLTPEADNLLINYSVINRTRPPNA
jgi:hypothetical protein